MQRAIRLGSRPTAGRRMRCVRDPSALDRAPISDGIRAGLKRLHGRPLADCVLARHQDAERRASRGPPFCSSISWDPTVIPGTRLELVYAEAWGILSPLRLPIPPPGRVHRKSIAHRLTAQDGEPFGDASPRQRRLSSAGSAAAPPRPRRRFSARRRNCSWSAAYFARWSGVMNAPIARCSSICNSARRR